MKEMDTLFSWSRVLDKKKLTIVTREQFRPGKAPGKGKGKVEGSAKHWHDLYMERSHPKQRERVTWSEFVKVMRLPRSWASLSF